MVKVRFDVPEFWGDGQPEVTVRRGVKYATALVPGEKFDMVDAGGAELGVAETNTVRVKSYYDITLAEYGREHDPACRVYEGLLAAMVRAYGNFEVDEIVTVVFFTPTAFVKGGE